MFLLQHDDLQHHVVRGPEVFLGEQPFYAFATRRPDPPPDSATRARTTEYRYPTQVPHPGCGSKTRRPFTSARPRPEPASGHPQARSPIAAEATWTRAEGGPRSSLTAPSGLARPGRPRSEPPRRRELSRRPWPPGVERRVTRCCGTSDGRWRGRRRGLRPRRGRVWPRSRVGGRAAPHRAHPRCAAQWDPPTVVPICCGYSRLFLA